MARILASTYSKEINSVFLKSSQLIKVLVITYSLAMVDIKQYVFDDYVLRQYINKIENFKSIIDREYELLDIKSNKMYVVPFDRQVRVENEFVPIEGEWTAGEKVISKIETKKVKYKNLKCLQVTEYTGSVTPFGNNQSKTVKYFANLDKYLGKYSRSVYVFLGFKDFKYDPYTCKIRQDSVHDGDSFNILNIEIGYEMVDWSLIEEILGYPVVNEVDSRSGE